MVSSNDSISDRSTSSLSASLSPSPGDPSPTRSAAPLSARTKDKPPVLDFYLDYIMEKANDIRRRNQERVLGFNGRASFIFAGKQLEEGHTPSASFIPRSLLQIWFPDANGHDALKVSSPLGSTPLRPNQVNSPVKNLELKDYIPLPTSKEDQKLWSKYDLIANVLHYGEPGEGSYHVFVQCKSEELW
ncbi:hypothetical protein MLD38_036795 [Melastoma candidum]|uniref:Uncharacterized protein n=1 Tax=Melastoma candidum TaxID=119954 RepID=A0ACB9LL03_9MYRT|nr:hypothetical protein MLD38_036795 [Melastoma candidum]